MGKIRFYFFLQLVGDTTDPHRGAWSIYLVLSTIFLSRLAAEFPSELTAIPLEDIDPYYQNKKVSGFILINSKASVSFRISV